MNTTINASDRLIFVNIKKSYEAMINHDTTSFYYRESLKECTRKFWSVREDKANAASHILGCYKGIVKEAIKITSFFTSEDEYPGRKVFEGEELEDSQYIGMDLHDIFDTLANFRVKYYNL